VIATLDDDHYTPALLAIDKGYDLLLEKPVAQTARECVEIATAAEKKGVKVLVCHVLRYTPFYKTVKTLLMEGAVGEVVSVLAVEGVGNLHHSHSYVRGNWKSEEESTPMLLAKCCHDLDIIQWLVGKKCERVSSFGSLSYFTPENAPENAPLRCAGTYCAARPTCPYDVYKIYFEEGKRKNWRYAAVKSLSLSGEPTNEEVHEGLEKSNYGACVYHAGNDVVDHQVVNMTFDGGATASLSMNAFNQGGRYLRIFGTRGELYAHAKETEITLYSFATKEKTTVPIVKTEESLEGGHGGGDYGIIKELYDYLCDDYKGFCAASIDVSVQNHIIGFAAEKARRDGTVESVPAFAESVLKNS